MIDRPFWVERIQTAWKRAPIAWLCGVRRSGKTSLARSLGEDRVLYLDCDLPQVEDQVRNPELFYASCRRPILIFDEIHQLKDPSRLLKIGADHFPHLRILATGSSTLAASRKFRDTLTGRKRTLHLTPVTWGELRIFGNVPLSKRLHHGGLPPALLAGTRDPGFYREWMASFFARDVQRLFQFKDLNRFTSVFEYLLRQSGGQFEVTRASSDVGVTRPTIENHLRALEVTHAMTVVRPFHGGAQVELVKQPKVYGFDTGFVAFARGWDPLRTDDLGPLWKHLVLEQLQATLPDVRIQYWRDKKGHEVDFVLPRSRDQVDAVECTWDPAAFDPGGLKAFRSHHPGGRNYLVVPSAPQAYSREIQGLEVRICTPSDLE